MNKSEEKAFNEWWGSPRQLIDKYGLCRFAFEAALDYKKKTGKAKHFEEFWKRYPTKVKKIPARAIWIRLKLDKKIDLILADLAKRNEDVRWQEGYIPDPTTYLNQERWTDEVTERPTVKKLPRTNEDWEEEGRKLTPKITPGVGESWPVFKDRVRARL